MTLWFESLGAYTLAVFARLGRACLFFLQLLGAHVFFFSRPGLLITQLHSVGVRSIPIIAVAGLFVGMVLGLQGYNNLVQFGAEASLGTLVALSLLRELGPVVAALLYAGRAGSALTAEIALLKTTEQLSSMKMMAVDPFKRVLAPRFLAGFLALPLLASIFTAVGILGSYFVAVEQLGVDGGAFWSQMHANVEFQKDVINGVLIKSLVFGVVANLIALFEGYDAEPTSEGIANATTRSVVTTSLAVLGLDFILTAILFGDF